MQLMLTTIINSLESLFPNVLFPTLISKQNQFLNNNVTELNFCDVINRKSRKEVLETSI